MENSGTPYLIFQQKKCCILFYASELSKVSPELSRVADHYYKLEISNISNPSKKIWVYSELMKNKDFIIASAKELYR